MRVTLKEHPTQGGREITTLNMPGEWASVVQVGDDVTFVDDGVTLAPVHIHHRHVVFELDLGHWRARLVLVVTPSKGHDG